MKTWERYLSSYLTLNKKSNKHIPKSEIFLKYLKLATTALSPVSTSCQIGSGALANRDLQLSLKIFKWLQVQVLGCPLWHLFQIQSTILHVWFRVLTCRKVYLLSCSAQFSARPVFGSICVMEPTSWCSVLTPDDSQVISSTWFLPVEMLGFQAWQLNFCLIKWEKALSGIFQVDLPYDCLFRRVKCHLDGLLKRQLSFWQTL